MGLANEVARREAQAISVVPNIENSVSRNAGTFVRRNKRMAGYVLKLFGHYMQKMPARAENSGVNFEVMCIASWKIRRLEDAVLVHHSYVGRNRGHEAS